MRVGIVTSNTNFVKGVMDELHDRRGHELLVYQHNEDLLNVGWQLGQLCAQTDAIFVDFAQDPCLTVMVGYTKRLVVRVHRLEMYAPGIEDWPWDRVECVAFIAEHVRERFLQRLTKVQPQSTVVLPHVGVDLDKWAFAEREWKPPWKLLLAGNVLPKKRVYTAIQMLADMPEDLQLHIVGPTGGLPGYGNDEYGANISDLVKELGLQERVFYHDKLPQEQLANVMRQCHLIGSWSNEEGCHTTVAEGMATGLISLVGNWRGAAAIYGEEAIWRSPLHCYQRVVEFIASEEEFKRAASVSAAQYVKRFDAKVVNAQLADLIEGSQSAEATYDAHVGHQVEQYANPRQRRCLALLSQYADPTLPYLDVGCGVGYVVSMAAYGGLQAIGLDISQVLLEQAAYKGHDAASWVKGDVAKGIPMPAEGQWGTVSFFDSLEHVPTQDRQAALANAVNGLAEGGVLLLTFPWQAGDPEQKREWPIYPKTVGQFLRRIGMEEIANGPLDDTYWFMAWRKQAEQSRRLRLSGEGRDRAPRGIRPAGSDAAGTSPNPSAP